MFTKFREKPLEAQSLLSKVAHQRLIKRDFILELFVWILRNCLETLLQTPDKDYKNWLKLKNALKLNTKLNIRCQYIKTKQYKEEKNKQTTQNKNRRKNLTVTKNSKNNNKKSIIKYRIPKKKNNLNQLKTTCKIKLIDRD